MEATGRCELSLTSEVKTTSPDAYDAAKPFEEVADPTAKKVIEKVRDALRAVGISVWGWQVSYGKTVAQATAEANCAIGRAATLDLDGVLMEAELGDLVKASRRR